MKKYGKNTYKAAAECSIKTYDLIRAEKIIRMLFSNSKCEQIKISLDIRGGYVGESAEPLCVITVIRFKSKLIKFINKRMK